jgi:putative colanic acid biosynthesis acetyltransferase WcaF
VTRRVDLTKTSNRGYDPGRSFFARGIWFIVESLVFSNPLVVPYPFKRWLLRTFGAEVGEGVIIKPRVRIKYPWHLSIGNHAWIGEASWIDNFVRVRIGDHACISQGAYLCTGNHDWSHPGMPLMVAPVTVEDGAWVGAFARVGPGVTVGSEAVLTLASVLLADAEQRGVYTGNPATWVRERRIEDVAPLPAG